MMKRVLDSKRKGTMRMLKTNLTVSIKLIWMWIGTMGFENGNLFLVIRSRREDGGARKRLVKGQEFNDGKITLECMKDRKVTQVSRVYRRSLNVC